MTFPDPGRRGAPEVLAVGCDFSPATVLSAYRSGIFPWPHGEAEDGAPLVPWISPKTRAVFPLDRPPHWSRSLRRTLRVHPYAVTLDTAFPRVMEMCGRTRPEGTWIIPELVEGYVRLHAMGWTHSVEVWDGPTLVGGIYGIGIGAAFSGESMFHTRTDASKIAFATLASSLLGSGFRLFDVQVQNAHLASLGCVELPRADYLEKLANARDGGPRLALFHPQT